VEEEQRLSALVLSGKWDGMFPFYQSVRSSSAA